MCAGQGYRCRGIAFLAREKEIDLTVVGPEAALVAGIVDRFREEGLRIFGPTKAAARIESSKEFAKDLMGRYGIPTAGYRAFDDYRKASEYVRSRPARRPEIRWSGLRERVSLSPGRWRRPMPRCATCCWTTSSARDVWSWRISDGPEFSFMCFVSGRKVLPMVLAQDHKRAFDGDEGPNTGGMAILPAAVHYSEDEAFALEKVILKLHGALVRQWGQLILKSVVV